MARREDLISAYLAAIELELRQLESPREVDTLFLGGGTPTHLSCEQLRQLVRVVKRWFKLADAYEFSVEANPEDLNEEKVDTLVELGVSRISLGVQSFAEDKLELLERNHRADKVSAAIRLCRSRFASISCDLMFGVPGETPTHWHDDLRHLMALRPQHISTYGLTFEKGTAFWSKKQKAGFHLITEDEERGMYLDAIEMLTSAGYEHYEVSNFARPHHRCRHNVTYWLGNPYFAAGPGAARYVDGVRSVNHRSTTTYLKRVLAGGSPIAESDQLAPRERAIERLVFAMRIMEGLDRHQFRAATGWRAEELVGAQLAHLEELEMIQVSPDRIMLTDKGVLVSDSVFSTLLG